MSRWYLIVVVCLWPMLLMSKTLNPVVSESATSKLDRSITAVTVGNSLVYYQLANDEHQIWAHDLHNNVKTQLHAFASNEGRVLSLNKVGESVVFVKESNGRQLWQSDLSVAGTKRLGDFEVSLGGGKVVNGLYFFIAFEPTRLVSFDGGNTTEYPLSTIGVPDDICVFSQNNVIAAHTNISADTIISQVINNNVVDLTATLPAEFRLADTFGDNTFQINDKCFIEIYNHTTRTTDYLIFSADGSVERANEVELFQGYRTLFLIGPNLYALVGNSFIKYNSDLTGIEKELDFGAISTDGLHLSSLKSSNHNMTIKASCPDCSPAIPSSYIFNADLELTDVLGNVEVFLYSQRTADIILVQNSFNKNIYQLKYPDETTLSNRAIGVNEVIVDPDQDGPVVVYGTDVLADKQAIYVGNEVPDIGIQINGPWHNPAYKNQGFNFYRGIRQDGSHYLNVTGFFYLDGAPYWVAGVGEVGFPQKTIDVVLAEYEGIGFLEPEAQPVVTAMGTLSLKFTACDALLADLNTIYGDHQIELIRINDFVFDDYCVD